jgi:hypothetical protein
MIPDRKNGDFSISGSGIFTSFCYDYRDRKSFAKGFFPAWFS